MALNTCMTQTAALRDTIGPHGGRSLTSESKNTESDIDLRLVQRCAEHDSAALREIVQRHQSKLYGFLYQILGSPEDAEEATQDVFLRVWQHAGRFEGRSGFATWLYRIGTNVAYDLLRRRKSRGQTTSLEEATVVSTVDAEAQALEGLERAESAQQLQRALQELRDDDRLLLVLYYGEERDYDEIRAITGYSYPVLKVRLLRARRRLRTILEARMGESMEPTQ
jgi:RNA polymerase sigma-70 factor (ECF subfamily)